MNEIANAKMVTLAREAQGMSQKELADRMKVSQSAISKIEKGVLKAGGSLLQSLSTALELPESFFCRPYEIYPAPMQFYRKHKTLPSKMSQRIEAALNIYRLHAIQLLDAAEIDFDPIPSCDLEEYGSAREVARAMRQFLRLPRGPVENVIKVLEDHGILVMPFDAGTHQFLGVSMLINTSNHLIMVNSRLSPDKLRWTLVHELAHIVMHQLPTPTMEAEAEEFAGEFLLPSELFIPEVRHLKNARSLGTEAIVRDLAAQKRHWKVSMSALVTNASKLDIFTEWETRWLWIKLAEAGITRSKEPLDSTIEVESAELIGELIEYYLTDLGYSVDELSTSLGMYPQDFLTMYKPRQHPLTGLKKRSGGLTLV